jgi:hypothetical protein
VRGHDKDAESTKIHPGLEVARPDIIAATAPSTPGMTQQEFISCEKLPHHSFRESMPKYARMPSIV